jgi:hypothetical protein
LGLAPAERAHLARLKVAARRADWRLGRWTAKLATAACLRVPAAMVELRAAPDGAPEALVGSAPEPPTALTTAAAPAAHSCHLGRSCQACAQVRRHRLRS